MNNAQFMWCDIDKVATNPVNPRIDPSVKTEEMQRIIRNAGWEQAITVYPHKSGQFYIIISGHRRYYSAREMGLKEIPIFITNHPDDEVNELERIADIQGGQVDWTQYEWAEYTYNIHEKLNMSYQQLGKKLNVSSAIIAARIRVFLYYQKKEIEAKLANETYTIKMLDYIRFWIEKLKKYHPNVVENFTEEHIKKTLLKKYENRVLNSYISNDESMIGATYEMIVGFLMNANKKITDLKREVEKMDSKNKVTNIKHNKKKVKTTAKEIQIIELRNKREAEVLKEELESLQKEIREKREYLKKAFYL